jgi:hypothetical protein
MKRPAARAGRLDVSPKTDRIAGFPAKRDQILLAQNYVGVARLKHELYRSRRRRPPEVQNAGPLGPSQ